MLTHNIKLIVLFFNLIKPLPIVKYKKVTKILRIIVNIMFSVVTFLYFTQQLVERIIIYLCHVQSGYHQVTSEV